METPTTQAPLKSNAPLLMGVDIGSPQLRGSTKTVSNRIEVSGAGADIWNTRDEFHFAFTHVSGNFECFARLTSLQMADVYTKAGLMFRTTLYSGAEHLMLLAFGDNQPRNNNQGGIEFQARKVPDGPCVAHYPPHSLSGLPQFPANFPEVWLKLTRDGNLFRASYSRDGIQWETYCEHRQSFPPAAYIGLAVTSHNPQHVVSAVFDHLCLSKISPLESSNPPPPTPME